MFALSFWEICVKKTTENRWQADFPCSRGGRMQCCPLGTLTLAATQFNYSPNQNKASEQREKTDCDGRSKKQMDKLPDSIPKVSLILCPSSNVMMLFTVDINHNWKKEACPVVLILQYPGHLDLNLFRNAQALRQPWVHAHYQHNCTSHSTFIWCFSRMHTFIWHLCNKSYIQWIYVL